MTNILVPLGGESSFFPREEYFYPKSLIEIHGRPMIQRVVENLATLSKEVRFTFVINKADRDDFHLDQVLRLLCGDDTTVVILDGATSGATCSCLMAVESIAAREPLVIVNSDQLFDLDLSRVLNEFESKESDAGLVVFEAIHPRWSFARIEDGEVVETNEKRPISRHAVAGFYYFREAQTFFDGAMLSIKRNALVDGKFYISSVFNELVLTGKRIHPFFLEAAQYHTLYTPQKLAEFEDFLKHGNSTILKA